MDPEKSPPRGPTPTTGPPPVVEGKEFQRMAIGNVPKPRSPAPPTPPNFPRWEPPGRKRFYADIWKNADASSREEYLRQKEKERREYLAAQLERRRQVMAEERADREALEKRRRQALAAVPTQSENVPAQTRDIIPRRNEGLVPLQSHPYNPPAQHQQVGHVLQAPDAHMQRRAENRGPEVRNFVQNRSENIPLDQFMQQYPHFQQPPVKQITGQHLPAPHAYEWNPNIPPHHQFQPSGQYREPPSVRVPYPGPRLNDNIPPQYGQQLQPSGQHYEPRASRLLPAPGRNESFRFEPYPRPQSRHGPVPGHHEVTRREPMPRHGYHGYRPPQQQQQVNQQAVTRNDQQGRMPQVHSWLRPLPQLRPSNGSLPRPKSSHGHHVQQQQPPQALGRAQSVGPSQRFGLAQPLGQAQFPGPAQSFGLALPVGPSQPIRPAQSLGAVQPVGSGQNFGPAQSLGQPQAPGPARPLGLNQHAELTQPLGTLGTAQPFVQAQPPGSSQPIDPVQSVRAAQHPGPGHPFLGIPPHLRGYTMQPQPFNTKGVEEFANQAAMYRTHMNSGITGPPHQSQHPYGNHPGNNLPVNSNPYNQNQSTRPTTPALPRPIPTSPTRLQPHPPGPPTEQPSLRMPGPNQPTVGKTSDSSPVQITREEFERHQPQAARPLASHHNPQAAVSTTSIHAPTTSVQPQTTKRKAYHHYTEKVDPVSQARSRGRKPLPSSRPEKYRENIRREQNDEYIDDPEAHGITPSPENGHNLGVYRPVVMPGKDGEKPRIVFVKNKGYRKPEWNQLYDYV